jgi:hypothetical protein
LQDDFMPSLHRHLLLGLSRLLLQQLQYLLQLLRRQLQRLLLLGRLLASVARTSLEPLLRTLTLATLSLADSTTRL